MCRSYCSLSSLTNSPPCPGLQQEHFSSRGDHPLRLPGLHHGAVHRLSLLPGPGHPHGRHGGHGRGRPERHPHQGRGAPGDGTQGGHCLGVVAFCQLLLEQMMECPGWSRPARDIPCYVIAPCSEVWLKEVLFQGICTSVLGSWN